MLPNLLARGRFHVEIVRDGRVIKRFRIKNLVTTAGKALMLNAMFAGAASPGSWYSGIIDNTGYSAIAITDTMASHPGWTEFTTYSQATRVAWGVATTVTNSISNGTVMTFTTNAGGTVRGLFITNNNVKGGIIGTLWSMVLFTSAQIVNSGDTIRLVYTAAL